MFACRDCKYFTRDRRSPLYPDLEIYDCFSCPYALHIWSDGRRYCCSSQFACRHFVFRSYISSGSLFYDENVGEQLTLF